MPNISYQPKNYVLFPMYVRKHTHTHAPAHTHTHLAKKDGLLGNSLLTVGQQESMVLYFLNVL